MYIVCLKKVIETIKTPFSFDELRNEYFKEVLRTFNPEEELSNEESETEQGTATRTKEVEISFGEEQYLIIKLRGYYKIYEEPETNFGEETFQGFDILDIENKTDLTDEEINTDLS